MHTHTCTQVITDLVIQTHTDFLSYSCLFWAQHRPPGSKTKKSAELGSILKNPNENWVPYLFHLLGAGSCPWLVISFCCQGGRAHHSEHHLPLFSFSNMEWRFFLPSALAMTWDLPNWLKMISWLWGRLIKNLNSSYNSDYPLPRNTACWQDLGARMWTSGSGSYSAYCTYTC